MHNYYKYNKCMWNIQKIFFWWKNIAEFRKMIIFIIQRLASFLTPYGLNYIFLRFSGHSLRYIMYIIFMILHLFSVSFDKFWCNDFIIQLILQKLVSFRFLYVHLFWFRIYFLCHLISFGAMGLQWKWHVFFQCLGN